MDRWIGKTAVVTGASSGIGAAIAVTLANRGLHVVGAARRQNLIDALKSKVTGPGSLQSRKCDVSKPEEVDALFLWVTETFGGVDVMVNNAGVFFQGTITEVGPNPAKVDELMQQIDVNVKAVILCSRQAAASMHRRGVAGHIININSLIGHYVSSHTFFNAYCASKHAVTGFTKTLTAELANFKSKIKTTSLSPGLVQTAMADDAVGTSQAPVLHPQDIADSVVYLLSTPPHVNIEELTITHVGEVKL